MSTTSWVLKWDHYRDYQELTTLMHDFAARYPHLAKLSSLGPTYQGREIWMMELTNTVTGPAEEKPGFQIDGNTHAGEVTGCEVALKTIWHLLSHHGSDPFVTELLDTRAIYVIPRIAADGAEHYLKTPGAVRSSMRPYPYDTPQNGLYPDDIDGNGWIVQMRIPDPNGDWKVCPEEPRLMIKRQSEEHGESYYRLYPEGMIRNWNGGEIKVAPPLYNLDFNRNWPSNWSVTEDGAGPFPLCEPENRAIADFWRNHPNISGLMTYHTFSGVIIRPFVTKWDHEMDPKDLAVFQEIGEIGTKITGYPAVSVFEGLTSDKKNPRHGNSKDWWYEDLGVFDFCIELWCMANHAGIEIKDYMGFINQRSVEDDLKLLHWNDTELDGQGFMDWSPFDHQQLGRVELGGWKFKYTFQNPPPHLLEAEIDKCFMFALRQAALSPLVRISDLDVTPISEHLYRVQAVIENQGYLPTYITQRALQIRIDKPVAVSLTLTNNAILLAGKNKTSVGHLEGRANRPRGTLFFAGTSDQSARRLEWLIKSDGLPTQINVEVHSEKGGTDRKTITLV